MCTWVSLLFPDTISLEVPLFTMSLKLTVQYSQGRTWELYKIRTFYLWLFLPSFEVTHLPSIEDLNSVLTDFNICFTALLLILYFDFVSKTINHFPALQDPNMQSLFLLCNIMPHHIDQNTINPPECLGDMELHSCGTPHLHLDCSIREQYNYGSVFWGVLWKQLRSNKACWGCF